MMCLMMFLMVLPAGWCCMCNVWCALGVGSDTLQPEEGHEAEDVGVMGETATNDGHGGGELRCMHVCHRAVFVAYLVLVVTTVVLGDDSLYCVSVDTIAVCC